MGANDEVFQALAAAGVRYVVVGGTAVVLQGHARLTVDLDLAVDLAPDQLSTAMHAFTGIGLRPRLPVEAQPFAGPATRRTFHHRERGRPRRVAATPHPHEATGGAPPRPRGHRCPGGPR